MTMTPNKTSSVNNLRRGARLADDSCSASIAIQPATNSRMAETDRRRERFGLAVAVGMVFVRRRRRHDHAAPDDDGTENVRERFAGVGDERVRMADDAGDEFCAPKAGH